MGTQPFVLLLNVPYNNNTNYFISNNANNNNHKNNNIFPSSFGVIIDIHTITHSIIFNYFLF